MQPTTGIKKEYCDKFSGAVCYACLSSERHLFGLGEYADLFQRICSISWDLDSVSLCWECRALLEKVRCFQKKVEDAQYLMEQYNYEDLRSLSSLLTVKLAEESYPELENSKNIHTQRVKNPNVKQDSLVVVNKVEIPTEIKVENDIDYDNYDYEPFDEVKYEKLPVKILQGLKDAKKVKLKKKNIKRKQRYKLSTLKIENGIKTIPIGENDVRNWMELEKNCDFFKKLGNKCEKCVSKVQTSLKTHCRRCHLKTKQKQLECEYCQEYFDSQQSLQTHIQSHCQYYSCGLCEYKCYNKYHIKKHFATHTNVVKCLECDESFFNTREFFVHYRTLHTEFICDYCGKKCKTKRAIQGHIHRKHETYKCKYCSVLLKSYHSHREHYKLKHQIERTEASYCVQCNIQFDTLYLFRRHVNSSVAHRAERPPPKPKTVVQCLSCPKTYSKRSIMMNHYKKEHAKDPRFYCVECDKGFLNSTRYKDHMKYKHEGVEKERNCICHDCGRGFHTNRILANHMRTHTGERPFACEHCDSRFAQRVALASHVKFIHLRGRRRRPSTKGELVQIQPQLQHCLN